MKLPTILEKIIATKHDELARAKIDLPAEQLKAMLVDAPPAHDFFAALASTVAAGGIGLIAEVKKASPSKGVIRPDFDPVQIARTYKSHGATCISVLTDEQYFQGSLEFLSHIRPETKIPLLRKDFVIDPYQVWQARAAGADAVLLIAECLDDHQLETLYAEIRQLGMTALVELHDPTHLGRVVRSGARLIGINNRDLHTFEVDLEQCIRLRRDIPADRLVVGESGIGGHDDLLKLQQAGIGAVLVGESLMRQDDVGQAVDQLLGR